MTGSSETWMSARMSFYLENMHTNASRIDPAWRNPISCCGGTADPISLGSRDQGLQSARRSPSCSFHLTCSRQPGESFQCPAVVVRSCSPRTVSVSSSGKVPADSRLEFALHSSFVVVPTLLVDEIAKTWKPWAPPGNSPDHLFPSKHPGFSAHPHLKWIISVLP